MQKITSTYELRDAIQQLELQRIEQKQLLKEQIHLTRESLRPINLIKDGVSNILNSPNLIGNTLNTVVGLTAGTLTKKIVVGASGNLLKKFFGSILQVGITTLIAKNPEIVKSFGQNILHRIVSKKAENS